MQPVTPTNPVTKQAAAVGCGLLRSNRYLKTSLDYLLKIEALALIGLSSLAPALIVTFSDFST